MLTHFSVPWGHNSDCSEHEGTIYATMHILSQMSKDVAQSYHASAAPEYSAVLIGNVLHVGTLTQRAFNDFTATNLMTITSPVITYAQILNDVVNKREVEVILLTPAFVRVKNVCNVSPSPHVIFGSIMRRWYAITGISLPSLSWNTIKITDIDVTTKTIKYRNHSLKGVFGRIVYYANQDIARWLHMLVSFARYSGIGSHTTQGWGKVK